MTLNGITLEPPVLWLIAALVLAGLEIAVPGVFLIWIAAAAAVTGLIALVAPVGIAAQLLLFAVLCALSVFFGRRWYLRNPVEPSDTALNDRLARLIGETVEVVEPIRNGTGRVKVGDGVWTARGPDLPAGSVVRITGASGTDLVVDRVIAGDSSQS
jgi:inner membrane protein